MNSVLVSFCVSFIVLVALVAVAIILSKPKKKGKEEAQNISAGNENPARMGWKSWLLPFGIALILAIWTLWGALFFLAVVWIMRLDPKTDSKQIPFPSDMDKKRAKGTYTWLLVSPFLNVVVLLIAVVNVYSSYASTNQWVLIALIPLIFHLPVLSRLDSNSPFVFRHTQQAILLLALRATSASIALNVGRYPEDGLWLFLLGNGFLWLVGSLWGRGQAHRGTGWWINRKGEKVLAQGAVPMDKTNTGNDLEELFKSLNTEGNTAKQKALNAFRTGTSEIRKKAVLILSEMGEVEKF